MQSMPLLGGRNASAHAAGILEVLCTPPPPAAAAAGGSGPTSSSKGKSGKEGGAKQPARAASASSKSGASSGGTAAAAGAGGDATLATALQQAVLVADGLPALLKVCKLAAGPSYSFGNSCRLTAALDASIVAWHKASHKLVHPHSMLPHVLATLLCRHPNWGFANCTGGRARAVPVSAGVLSH